MEVILIDLRESSNPLTLIELQAMRKERAAKRAEAKRLEQEVMKKVASPTGPKRYSRIDRCDADYLRQVYK